MKIYLDDERSTPPGWIRTYTVEDTIALLLQHDGKVEAVSLDNDLGMGMKEGRKVMDFIEEMAKDNTLQPIPRLEIHTSNPVAHDIMMQSRYNAWKYWIGHGYDRKEILNKFRNNE